MESKKFFIKIERYVLYLNFLFAALLLLSYLSGVISPEKCWPLAFLGLIYLMLLYANIIFVVYWAIRLKRFFFISFVCILLGFNVLLNNIGINFFYPSTSHAGHLRVMTYNVHVFETTDNVPSYKEIPPLIDSIQPDILGVEECYSAPRFPSGYVLKNILHTTHFYFEPFKITPYDSTGLALFSKYPIINKGIIRLSRDNNDNQGIYIDVKYQFKIIRVYCFHLKSLQFDPVDYNNLDKFSQRGKISLYNLKEILWKLKVAFMVRAQQVDLIRREASKCPYPYIFIGDFNDTPSSYAFSQMSKGMKNAFRERGSGIAKTVDEGFASFQIDYILTTPQFNILNYEIVRKSISDHYPVYSDVALN